MGSLGWCGLQLQGLVVVVVSPIYTDRLYKGIIWVSWRSPAGLYINPSLASAVGPCMNKTLHSHNFLGLCSRIDIEELKKAKGRLGREPRGDWAARALTMGFHCSTNKTFPAISARSSPSPVHKWTEAEASCSKQTSNHFYVLQVDPLWAAYISESLVQYATRTRSAAYIPSHCL